MEITLKFFNPGTDPDKFIVDAYIDGVRVGYGAPSLTKEQAVKASAKWLLDNCEGIASGAAVEAVLSYDK